MHSLMGSSPGAMERIHSILSSKKQSLLAALRLPLRPQQTLPDTGAQCAKASLPDCGVPAPMRENDFFGN